MAVTGILSVSPSAVVNNQVVQVQLQLTGSAGSTAVQVLRVVGNVYAGSATTNDAAVIGNFAFTIGSSTMLSPSATANTTLYFNAQAIMFAPPAPLNPPYPNSPAYDTYTLTARAELGDGTVVTATSGTVLVYPLVAGSTLALSQAPGTIPGPGSLLFFSNLESGLLGALATRSI